MQYFMILTNQMVNRHYQRVSSKQHFLRFALEIQPTGEVSEYTATLTHGMLREGKKGRHKMESLKLTMRAEGIVMFVCVLLCVFCTSRFMFSCKGK